MTNPQKLVSKLWNYCSILILGKVAAGLVVCVLAGCAMPNGYYQPASVVDGVIDNPRVGWSGYSVKVPDGLDIFDPAKADPDSPELTQLQKWCLWDGDRYSRSMAIVYTESFLLEDPEGRGFIIFASDTLELSAPWSAWMSPEKEYFLRKRINEKLVLINDTKADNEVLTINGHRGWHISGIARPYFKKKQPGQAYEGYFILGNLKEVFWVEGWAPLAHREFLREKTREMAESLEIK